MIFSSAVPGVDPCSQAEAATTPIVAIRKRTPCIAELKGEVSCVHLIGSVSLRVCALQLGVYDEAGLQRLDLILAEAAKNNVRVIFPLVNVWPDLGGMQWWVDQVCR